MVDLRTIDDPASASVALDPVRSRLLSERRTPVGQPTPGDPNSFHLVALDTKTPYTLDFDGADGGKNAQYLLCWVNSTGPEGAVVRDGDGDGRCVRT